MIVLEMVLCNQQEQQLTKFYRQCLYLLKTMIEVQSVQQF